MPHKSRITFSTEQKRISLKLNVIHNMSSYHHSNRSYAEEIPSQLSLNESLVSPYQNSPVSHEREFLGICEGVPKSPEIYAGVKGSPEAFMQESQEDLPETYQESTMTLTTTLNSRIRYFIIIFTPTKISL